MKKLINISAILFVVLTVVGMVTYVNAKRTHSLDNLYKNTQEKKEEVKFAPPMSTRSTSTDLKENTTAPQKKNSIKIKSKIKQKPVMAKQNIIHAKPKMREIEIEKFSRAALDEVEFVPKVVPEKEVTE